MDLKDAETLAILHMEQHGLIKQGWKFSWDNSLRRFGLCSYFDRMISLSRSLVELNEEARVENTILHEIAHALVGSGHGHGRIWVRKAKEIGCNGQRCYNSEVVLPKFRGKVYVAVCSTCGNRSERSRAISNEIACGSCCREHSFGRFDRKFVLTWTKGFNV